MMARGDLRDHPAEVLVHDLRGDDIREQPPVAAEHGGAGVIAARLEGEDHTAGPPAHTGPGLGTSSSVPSRVAGVRHITSASSPLSW